MKITSRSILPLITGLAVLAAAAGAAAKDVEIFDGKTLNGWVQKGGTAKYAVEDGCIVGRSVLNTGNSFLCTEKDYGDFVLELDFKVNPALNSGIQIRSHCFDKETTFENKGKTEKIAAGRVHGYQIEIDNDPKRDRWWTAGLYEEGRRGWLFPGLRGGDGKQFTEQGRKITKADEWNHVKIEAKGDHIRTWLNGELRVDAHDGDAPTGFIALQVHGIGKDKDKAGTEVRWKNLKLEDLSK